ncbi:class I SAM-dependent methyltransferase [Caulobacter vibrioides]|uniref:Flagellin modification protein FlmE n=3 Tax=Caulobacter vibrioides TaxID=155892 RepID=H7C7H8_CAUVC|nr:class I SAM-dependent methyltransferase [Caulobacter vibrioides]YP_002518322.1 S-adenosylmethionine-dependent methyltransferase related protein [Caulobacter vibrioides NA1000]AAC62521.1 FLAZ protein [Caulobacter vibrioides CB15]AAK24820.1 flagellin modification protein FlmE [Caulobacter vibrioides CB15]ACL96414.1 S-adenosylmethionine-dependent methyltransferase related protein [Caulobacter vibrioides NA1000]ATC29689.1 class I SAM-dependent methyltransferase [Caulobacter vibrioides]QXZ51210
MRALPDIRGLKYPDEFIARHFFKRGLHQRTGRVVELGGGTGNNLSLYAAYGWDLTNVDYSAAALADCRWNLGDDVTLIEADLSKGLPDLPGAPIDVLLIPNLLCYLTSAQATAVLTAARARLAPGAEVFVRTRLIDDFRCGKGVEEEPNGWRLATPETGEAGLFNLFYTEDGLVRRLVDELGLVDPVALKVAFENIQNGVFVSPNSDLVVWGATA